MSISFVLDLATQTLNLTMLLCGPLLAAALSVGLGVSVVQAVTSVQEQTLSLVPKMLAVVLVALVMLAPTISLLRDFCIRVLDRLHSFGLS